MPTNNESKESDITVRTCYHFDQIININDFDRDNILLKKKSNENVWHYLKTLLITFDKVDWYIRKYERTKYLALFCSDEKFEFFFDRIRYLIVLKSNILRVYSHEYMKININLDNDLH